MEQAAHLVAMRRGASARACKRLLLGWGMPARGADVEQRVREAIERWGEPALAETARRTLHDVYATTYPPLRYMAVPSGDHPPPINGRPWRRVRCAVRAGETPSEIAHLCRTRLAEAEIHDHDGAVRALRVVDGAVVERPPESFGK